MGQDIHPTAFVHPGAEIGQGVSIGHCAMIEDKVVIGDHTSIGAFARIQGRTTIGKNNKISAYAFVGGDPQDLKYAGEDSELIMGDNNVVREFATIHRGTANGGMVTRIGSGCLIMAYVHIAHDCLLDDHIIMSNSTMLAGHVRIGSHAIIGGMSGLHQFVQVGEHAFVGGMTGVNQDVPPYMLVSGRKARNYGPNMIGLRRHGFTSETVSALRNAYRRIWRSEIPRPEAMDEIAAEYGHIPAINVLLSFVRNSARGVVSPPKEGDEPDM